MKTVILPEGLAQVDGICPPFEGMAIRAHRTTISSSKNRVTLSTHLFNFLLEGEKVLHYPGKTLRITPENFVLLSGNNCLMSERLSTGGQYGCVLFFFNEATLAGFFRRYPSLSRSQPAVAPPSHTAEPAVCFNYDPFIRNYVQSLQLMLEGGRTIPAEMQLLKFDELMLHLADHYPQQLLSFHGATRLTSRSGISDWQLQTVVETNLSNNITVEEMAFLCNTSLSTFKRRFAHLYGTSPNKWILQKRMERAAALLQDHGEKPSEVYHKVGYENHSSFTQSFKQIYGVTPREFQQRAAEPSRP